MTSAILVIFEVTKQKDLTMGKSTHLFGQSIHGQLIKSLNGEK